MMRVVSEREVECQRRRFRPSPGVTETPVSRGATRSILIVTETAFESGGFARFDAEHVSVVPGVSLVSVCGSQPLDVLIPVGSETVHETVTSDTYQPLSPSWPETWIVIDGGATEPESAAAGASATAAATTLSMRRRRPKVRATVADSASRTGSASAPAWRRPAEGEASASRASGAAQERRGVAAARGFGSQRGRARPP